VEGGVDEPRRALAELDLEADPPLADVEDTAPAAEERTQLVGDRDVDGAALDRAQAQLLESRALELSAEELRAAQTALSEITGEVTSDDLLGEIFSSFCIGK